MSIDLKHAEGLAAFERLAATADIFIHNMRPSVTKDLGIDGEALGWVARFKVAGVPCAPVNTVPEALEDAQVQALEMQSLVPGEDFVLTALPISFDGQRPAHRSVAPRLGQHNQEFDVPEKRL